MTLTKKSQHPHDSAPLICLSFTICSRLKEFMETLKKECLWLRSMSENLCARCEICLGTNQEPCTRHEERECSG